MTGVNGSTMLILRRGPVRFALGVVLTLTALALAWAVWVVNLERSCTLEQWPGLAICRSGADNAASQEAALQARAARNPGDSEAWIRLAILKAQPGTTMNAEAAAVLDTATRLAGQDYRVQRLQAGTALRQERWPDAVKWLVHLVQDNGDNDAALTLASMLREPKAVTAMQARIKPGDRWVGAVINALPAADLPTVAAMGLVVQALEQRAMSPELIQKVLQGLKAHGDWLDAHALWTAWLGRPVDLLFNGSFDQGFIAGGFDWEVLPISPSKAGAVVRQVALAGRGGVLQVEFSGRALTVVPVVRQPLLLLNSRYALTGQFMTGPLVSDGGLAWSLHCAQGGLEIARTVPLTDTSGQWRQFSLEVVVPPACGPAVVLQLQPFTASEAASGIRGQASFDGFTLKAIS